MAKKDKSRLPSGMGGLVRYDEEVKETLKIKPEYVIYFSLGVIVLELILRFLG
jgi:preprotein translocase subunit Sec61beta